MCAIFAGRRGRRVLVLDHADKLGGKILISGGGRCNFTNTGAGPQHFVSANPHFCKSALARFPPSAFLELVDAHDIAYHEKKLGQLFCDGSARDIVDMLDAECRAADVEFALQTRLERVERLPPGDDDDAPRFAVHTSAGLWHAQSLVVATGGLSIPKIGATGIGFDLARQFGLGIVPTAPALDGFTLTSAEMRTFAELSGLSVDCVLTAGGLRFREHVLFTHAGLSGPAALQGSLHWHPGAPITLDLLPDHDARAWLADRRKTRGQALLRTVVAERLPARLADKLCALWLPQATTLAAVSDADLEALAMHLHAWTLRPAGTVGYRKAEVTRGGVDTAGLSSKTMEARAVPGLFFVGEVVDVTGWLGGYNFQWAWSSGWAAGQVV